MLSKKINYCESNFYFRKKRKCTYCNQTGHHESKFFKHFKKPKTQGLKYVWILVLVLAKKNTYAWDPYAGSGGLKL